MGATAFLQLTGSEQGLAGVPSQRQRPSKCVRGGPATLCLGGAGRRVVPGQNSRRPAKWRRASSSVPAADGGSGNIGGIGGFGDSGGGGGGDGDAGRRKPKSGLLKGWEERMAADPQFLYKVFVEQVIGVGASVAGDMASRPNWGLNELDFVFATLVVGSIVNFSLMYLLAPTGAATAAASSTAKMGLLQKLFSEQTLKGMGAPGGHMFEPGFGLAGRATNLVYKGFVFAFVGMCAGLVGTATSNGLILLRQRLDPEFESPNVPPNVIANASTWALHMGVSSNIRYQILNGMDMVLQPMTAPALYKLFTFAVRTGNNVAGGISFVMLAKLLGVQKSADAAAPANAAA